ncbi:3501_t:CDS:2 [Acaulospora morrowiae]|uniref:3501_t:CDS:1 n=1 Tax=Acaulospora morrowiae TaxID=94023 RepID=A0A9N9FRS3_9GLOM|nr:3501_t:CDS:2 [Acaulospora morrowiae]
MGKSNGPLTSASVTQPSLSLSTIRSSPCISSLQLNGVPANNSSTNSISSALSSNSYRRMRSRFAQMTILLEELDIPAVVVSPDDCVPTLWVDCFEKLCGHIPDIIRHAYTPDAHLNNLRIIVGILAYDIIKDDLSHISLEGVLDMEINSILNMIEIFVLLQKIPPEQRLRNRKLCQEEKLRLVLEKNRKQKKLQKKSRNAVFLNFNNGDLEIGQKRLYENSSLSSISSLENKSMMNIKAQPQTLEVSLMNQNDTRSLPKSPTSAYRNVDDGMASLMVPNVPEVLSLKSREYEKNLSSSGIPNSPLLGSRTVDFIEENKENKRLSPNSSGRNRDSIMPPAVQSLTVNTDRVGMTVKIRRKEEFIRQPDTIKTGEGLQKNIDNNSCTDFIDLLTPTDDMNSESQLIKILHAGAENKDKNIVQSSNT